MYLCTILFGIVGVCACDDNDDSTSNLPSKIQAYGIQTRSVANDNSNLVFSGDNIEWFNATTREIKFKGVKPSVDIFPVYSKIEFRIDGKSLFTASSFVVDYYSQSFYDLVIYYSHEQRKYYLDDCYPNSDQIRNHEEVALNKAARAEQWQEFLNTLSLENKLRK